MRQTRRTNARLPGDLAKHMRCRFTFDGWIGRYDQFFHFAFGKTRGKKIESDFFRA